jgi:predicted RNA binding protein with dsRBD fold (UPF0201 family)
LLPEVEVSVLFEASVSPSEDFEKVLSAVMNVVGDAPCEVATDRRSVTVKSSSIKSLERIHDQLRDRRVRGAARKRLAANREGQKSTLMLNRQAASAGVLALCDNEQESPLGPIYVMILTRHLEEVIGWLSDFQPDSQRSS